jgi:hypothetical protein
MNKTKAGELTRKLAPVTEDDRNAEDVVRRRLAGEFSRGGGERKRTVTVVVGARTEAQVAVVLAKWLMACPGVHHSLTDVAGVAFDLGLVQLLRTNGVTVDVSDVCHRH